MLCVMEGAAMSHQARTWVEGVDETTGCPRWDVLINGRSVPGGYIVQTEGGDYEAHYPRMVPFRRATLEQAKERLEWAPPITTGQLAIGNEIDQDEHGFVCREKAAECLGVSVPRVNAMVSNGKLAARRAADGYEVGRSSIERILNDQAQA